MLQQSPSPALALLEQLAKTPAAQELSLIPTRQGSMSVLLDGIALHSRYDPQKEAIKELNQMPPHLDCIILAGLGLGYFALACADQLPDVAMIIIEPNITYLTVALDNLKKLQSHKRLAIFHGNPQEIATSLPSELANWQIKHPFWYELRPRVEYKPEDFTACRIAVKEYQQRLRVNDLAISQYGRLWWANGLRNWHKWREAHEVIELFEQFQQLDVLVVAAGPSLSYHLSALPKLQKRMLIICVDTALRILLAANIKPDIVVAIDSQYWNARHLDNLDLSDILLVVDPCIHPMVMHKVNPPQLYIMQPLTPMYQQLTQHHPTSGYLRSGGSVTLTAWDLALQLNPRSIWLLGSDFAYPNQLTHAKGALFEQWLLASCDRFNSLIQQQNLLKHASTNLVISNQGQYITSDARMQLYRRWLEEALPSTRIPTYNLSTLGAKIAGAPYMELNQALALPHNRSLINQRLNAIAHQSIKPRLIDHYLLEIDHLTQLSQLLDKLEHAPIQELLEEPACATFSPILPLWLTQLKDNPEDFAAAQSKLKHQLQHLLKLSQLLMKDTLR